MAKKGIRKQNQPTFLLDATSSASYQAIVATNPPLSEAEKKELGRIIVLAKDPNASSSQIEEANKAKERLTLTHIGLVLFLMGQMNTGTSGGDDLIQSGIAGLLEAIDRYDPDSPAPFASYATPFIQAAMRQCLYELSGSLSLPKKKRGDFRKILKVYHGYLLSEGKEPDEETLRALLPQYPPKIIEEALSSSLSFAEESEGMDAIGGEDESIKRQFDEDLTLQKLEEALDCLDEKKRRVIALLYGLEGESKHNKAQVGRILGLSRERIRVIEAEALYQIKQFLGGES